MLIDFHTHCFPDAIASKAVLKLSYASGGLNPHTNGTLCDLKRAMKDNDVDISVVLSIATNEKQQKNVNDFAARLNSLDGIIAFGSVYPRADDALEELERICALGLRGVKLHPDYQHFSVDDEKMRPIYKKISDLGLITVFHAGFDYGFPPPYGATPQKMAKALNWFDAPVVAAHWGGLSCGDDVLAHLAGRDIYFDISFGYGTMPKFYAEKILEKHGTDRILFGTDTPWHSADMEMRLLNTLNLCENDLDKIKYKNAKNLLNI